MSFLKVFFSSCLGTFVAMILLFVIIFSIAAVSGDEEVEVKETSVLELDLDGPINEIEKENPFGNLPLLGSSGPKAIGLAQLRRTIEHAKKDPKIKGIYLNVSYPMAGYAGIEEIRNSLIDFKSDGKWVIVYGDMLSESAYYLASSADKIYLNPEGELEFNGLTAEITFFKRLFDKLEIKPEVFRVGEFKSAVEPFLLEKMSDPNKLQMNEMIHSIYNHIIEQVAASRHIPKEKLREISDKMLVRNATLAKEYGLVDSLVYLDEVKDDIKKRIGVDNDKDIDFIKYAKYKRSVSSYKDSPNEVAVIVAEGTILPGKSTKGQGVVGAETFTDDLRKARLNDKVKAIVIRINSPGGSFQASDAMWREVSLAAKTKPVIASMSDYAASGGYYIAMGCDTIVAQANTITGSIGIFSVLFDASGFLNNKIGITTEEIKTGEIGQLVTMSRPLNEVEKAIWQTRTNEIYETFTGKAAKGRKMPIDDLKKVASGRVWTGTQAKENGLVDIIGSFDDAVNIAAKSAKVADDYKVKFYPQYNPSVFEQVIDQFEEEARVNTLKEEMGSYYYMYQQWNNIKSYQGIQARLPYEIKIQ